MNRAIIYTRFSPRKNAGDCDSCETQQAYCEQHAHVKGYTIDGIFHDKDVSGADEFREKLWKAILAIKKGDVLVVMKRDRLARHVWLQEQINRAVAKAGGRIEAVSGDVEGNSDEVVMIRQMLSVIAEYERKMIAKRTKFAMLHHQRNGRRMGRYTPYGWKTDPNDPKGMVLDRAEGVCVERILSLARDGMSPWDITKDMNKEMSEGARAGRWNVRTILKVISRAA